MPSVENIGYRAHSPNEFFSKHAHDYAMSKSHAHGSDLTLLSELLRPRKNEEALDVATGTGFTAMAVAKKVKFVTATDITSEMLDEARKLSKEKKIVNIRFEKANATNLHYDDSSFDIVTSRRAAHHFDNVRGFLEEARRVLRPRGRLGIADMSPPEGTERFWNRIETIRDKTHVRALTATEWKEKLIETDLMITKLRLISERTSFERWYYPASVGGNEEQNIREEWRKAPANIRKALGVMEKKGRVISWLKSWIVIVARRD